MKIKMKNIFLVVLLFVFCKTSQANIILSSYSLKNVGSDNKLIVNDSQLPTDFEFRFTLLNYGDQYYQRYCYVTLLYTESPENNNYDSHPSTIEISSTKYASKPEFTANGTLYQSDWLPAVLPAYKSTGKFVLRYKFFHSSQNKEVSWYSTVTYGINAPPIPQYAVNITNVTKVERMLIGTDCGFIPQHMEKDAWAFAYNINFTKNNSSISDSDIFWEWVVLDPSFYFAGERQFLVYPYGTTKSTPLNGEAKVTVEANDYLDEYDSKVIVRAKSRSTNTILSSDYTFYFAGVNH